ncbi:hypothetical protein ABPG72_015943 [Tetrahymena utriculariae]
MKATFLKQIFGFALFMLCVKAQNCQNLLSQLATPKTYQGYECVVDMSQSFKSNLITMYSDKPNYIYVEQLFASGECNQQYLINPNYAQGWNDAIIRFTGQQTLSYVQISFSFYFYTLSNTASFLAFSQSGTQFTDQSTIENPIDWFNPQSYCAPNFKKTFQKYLVNINALSSDVDLQTYLSPPNIKNQMGDIQVLVYYKCPIGCSQCDNQGKCSSCISNYSFKSNYCYITCNANQFAYPDPNSSQQSCKQCDASCQSCFGDSRNCTACASNYYPVDTQASSSTFNCYQPCPNNYQFVQNKCQQCSSYNSKDCQLCGVTCRGCQNGQTNICLDCYQTMQMSGNTCVCKNNQDQRNIFYQCSYDNIAVIQAFFAGDSPTLILELGSTLIPVNNLKCDQIFDSNTLALLGSNSKCAVKASQIVVSLSQDAIITANQILGFNSAAKVLQFQGYSNPIDTFYLISVVQNIITQPSVQIKYKDIENSCNDISFTIQSIQNDAKRGFLQFQWSLVSPLDLSVSTLQTINKIIQTANNQQSKKLVLKKQIFPPDTSITVQLSYILKVNQNGTLPVTTYYSKDKQIVISSIQNVYSPIYRYMNLTILFSYYVQVCDLQVSTVTYESLDIQFISQVLPTLNKSQKQFNGEQIKIDIAAYSIPQSTTLDIQAQAALHSNSSVISTYNLQITPELPPLFIQIFGAQDQRLVDYKANRTLVGLYRDYEVQNPSSDQGIQLGWICQNVISINGDNKCYDYLKKVFTPPQNSPNVTILERTFDPYQCINFTLQGTKDSRTNSQSTLFIFSEVDVPPLYVVFDDPTQIYQVNINDDIQAELQYDSNAPSNILTYAGAVLYNNLVVGVIKFDYFKVKLRIWDYFSNLDVTNPIVQIRFSVYNPQSIMPSLAIINFNINIPPQKCVFSVTPTNGVSLQTNFTITFTGCTTKHNPLLYQFFYYNQLSDQQSEIQSPQNILRRQIQDLSTSFSITTILPSGDITLIGQAMDTYLAVFNSTTQVSVLPYEYDEQTLLNLIEQAIQKNNDNNVKKSIVNLCVVAEEISKNKTLYSQPSINQAKINLINSILNLTNFLPNQSFLSTFANKVVAQTQQSLVVQQEQQSSTVLNQIKQILMNQQQITNDKKQYKLLDNNDIVLQNLVDSFKMLNSTTQNVDVNSISQNFLQAQISLSDQIGSLLNNITLPNQGQFEMKGNLISLNCEQITQKNLKKYVYEMDEGIKNDSSIYNVVVTNYSQNPFQATNEFQNYVNQLKNLTPGIQVSSNPVIKSLIQNFTGNQTLNLNKQIQMSFSNIQPSKYNLTCIQQQQLSWQKKNCQILQSTFAGQYSCFCQDQKPTTIIEDVESLINNKNLQTAFGSQGILNISNFKYFYEYVIFFILSVLTLLQIGLCYFGNKLDKTHASQTPKSLKIAASLTPEQLILSPQENQVSQRQQLQTERLLLQPKILNNKGRYESGLNVIQNTQDKEENKKEDQISEREELRISKDASGKKKQKNKKRKSTSMIKQNIFNFQENQAQQIKQNQTEKDGQRTQILTNIQQNTLNIIYNFQIREEYSNKFEKKYQAQKNQEKKKENFEDQRKINKESKSDEKSDKLHKILQKSILWRILIFHNFSTIFFTCDQKLSRPLRFSIYYLRMIHSLSISTIFDEKYDETQMIIVAIINVFIISISVLILETLYKFRKIGRAASSILMVGLLLLYYYIILAIISGESSSYSNSKIINFLILFGLDFVVISTLLSVFSSYILLLNTRYPNNYFIKKLFTTLQIQNAIQNIFL